MPGTFAGSSTLTPSIDIALALGDRLLRGPPVDGCDVVAVALRGGDLELAGSALGVVGVKNIQPSETSLPASPRS